MKTNNQTTQVDPVVTEPVAPVQPVNPTPVTAQPAINPVGTNGGLKAKLFKYGPAPVIIAVVVLVAVVGLVAYSTISSSPKAVFKGVVNNVFKKVDNTLESTVDYSEFLNFKDNAITMSFDANVDTNAFETIEGLEDYEIEELLGFDLKDLTVGATIGYDFKDDQYLIGAKVKGEKETITADIQFEDGVAYIASSLLEDVLKYEDETIDMEELKEEMEYEFGISLDEFQYNPEDYRTIVKSVKNAINASISNEFTEKDSEEI